MSRHHHICNLCGDRHGRSRDGRLGRYSLTCDDCEARKGSHLVKTQQGYASRVARGLAEPILII